MNTNSNFCLNSHQSKLLQQEISYNIYDNFTGNPFENFNERKENQIIINGNSNWLDFYCWWGPESGVANKLFENFSNNYITVKNPHTQLDTLRILPLPSLSIINLNISLETHNYNILSNEDFRQISWQVANDMYTTIPPNLTQKEEEKCSVEPISNYLTTSQSPLLLNEREIYSNVSQKAGTLSNDHRNFSQRNDVVKKTILRSFKKHYVCHFKSYYNFMKRVRRLNFNASEKVFKMAEGYIQQTFGWEIDKTVSIILVAIVDTKEKFKHPNPIFSEVRSQVLNVMKSFNLDKLLGLWQYKEFSFLIKKFLSLPLDQICRYKHDPEVRLCYIDQIRWLQMQLC